MSAPFRVSLADEAIGTGIITAVEGQVATMRLDLNAKGAAAYARALDVPHGDYSLARDRIARLAEMGYRIGVEQVEPLRIECADDPHESNQITLRATETIRFRLMPTNPDDVFAPEALDRPVSAGWSMVDDHDGDRTGRVGVVDG